MARKRRRGEPRSILPSICEGPLWDKESNQTQRFQRSQLAHKSLTALGFGSPMRALQSQWRQHRGGQLSAEAELHLLLRRRLERSRHT